MKKMISDRNLKVRQLLSFPDAQKLLVKEVEERRVVRIGDWCLFESLVTPKRDYLFLLGRVLQFQSLSDNNKKPQFDWNRGTDQKLDDDLGVVCTWYRFDAQTKKSKKISTKGTKFVVVHGRNTWSLDCS